MIFGFVIWSILALAFIFLSIRVRTSAFPAGFFSGLKPPPVRDVKAYNRALSRLWLCYGLFLEMLALPLLFRPEGVLYPILAVLGLILFSLSLPAIYNRIVDRHRAEPKNR